MVELKKKKNTQYLISDQIAKSLLKWDIGEKLEQGNFPCILSPPCTSLAYLFAY